MAPAAPVALPVAASPTGLARWLPGLAALRRYDPAWLGQRPQKAQDGPGGGRIIPEYH